MSIEIIHLKKLLQLFYAPANLRVTLLRGDIRQEIAKASSVSGDGGDFHGPFWADAKRHAVGQIDLREATKFRVQELANRRRLYPELAEGFLTWWNEKRRWHNEPLLPFEAAPHARLKIGELGTIKVENLLCVRSGGGFRRLVYPYFSERPTLPEEGGRLGLWALAAALREHDVGDMRILDVLRSRTFATGDYPLRGDEGDVFARRYKSLIDQRNELLAEY